MIHKYLYPKNFPTNCLICTFRPIFFLGKWNVNHADYSCPHSKPNYSERPKLSPKLVYKIINLVLSIILLFGIYNDICLIELKLTAPYIIIVAEILCFISTIALNVLMLFKEKIKLLEFRGLSLILANSYHRYGIQIILSEQVANKMFVLSWYLIIIVAAEEFLYLIQMSFDKNKDMILLVRMVAMEVFIFCQFSLAMFVLLELKLYEALFKQCYFLIKETLNDYFQNRDYQKNKLLYQENFFQKFKRYQKLHLALKRNYKTFGDCLVPELALVYMTHICLLMICYSYIFVLFVFYKEVEFTVYDIFLMAKSIIAIGVFIILCHCSQNITSEPDKILSFLFKFPTNKLDPVESMQVNVCVHLLEDRPKIELGETYLVGTGILTSVFGTVVTYVLVLFQFNAIFQNKQ